MPSFDWMPLLRKWSQDLLDDQRIAVHLPVEIVQSGWLGFAGATEDQLLALEEQLGAVLPPSYRAFLRVSNGWRRTTPIAPYVRKMWATDKVDWFATRHQDWIDVYVLGDDGLTVLDEDYFVYGQEQHTYNFRAEYLQTALQVSEVSDTAVYLLNPHIRSVGEEWEGWYFADWLPGAVRYRSFLELMKAEHEYALRLLNNDLPPPHGQSQMLRILRGDVE